MKPLAVVCVSGGMDSCLTAAIAAGDHRLALLHANYGQRTQAKELACFRRLAEHFTSAHPAIPVAEVIAQPEDVHDLDGLRVVGTILSRQDA